MNINEQTLSRNLKLLLLPPPFQDIGDGWWEAKVVSTGETGLLPQTYVEVARTHTHTHTHTHTTVKLHVHVHVHILYMYSFSF